MTGPEIISKLNTLPFGRGEYWLVAGAAMVLHGFKSETRDIDLGCTRALADLLAARGVPFRLRDNGKRWFALTDDIELFEDWLIGDTVRIEGFRVVSIEGLVAMKTELGREKDLEDIALIMAHLANVKTVL